MGHELAVFAWTLMVIVQAMGVGVIRQDFDDMALADPAATALCDHTFEFRFQCLQTGNALFHRH